MNNEPFYMLHLISLATIYDIDILVFRSQIPNPNFLLFLSLFLFLSLSLSLNDQYLFKMVNTIPRTRNMFISIAFAAEPPFLEKQLAFATKQNKIEWVSKEHEWGNLSLEFFFHIIYSIFFNYQYGILYFFRSCARTHTLTWKQHVIIPSFVVIIFFLWFQKLGGPHRSNSFIEMKWKNHFSVFGRCFEWIERVKSRIFAMNNENLLAHTTQANSFIDVLYLMQMRRKKGSIERGDVMRMDWRHFNAFLSGVNIQFGLTNRRQV